MTIFRVKVVNMRQVKLTVLCRRPPSASHFSYVVNVTFAPTVLKKIANDSKNDSPCLDTTLTNGNTDNLQIFNVYY